MSTPGVTSTLEPVACIVCGSNAAVEARVRVPRDDHAVALALPGGRSHWVVCTQCGLVYQSPRPGPEAVAALYEGGSYHETRGGLPEHYVQYSLRRSVAALDWGLTHVGSSPEARRALDVGCGIGGALVDLERRGWDVVGIEPDPELGEVGRERFGLSIRSGFFDDDVFDDGESFDLVYSCHVWEHLDDPLATSAAAHRLLRRTEGHLLIVVPTFREARTWAWSCFTAPHTYMFTAESLGNVLRSAGFDVVAARYAAAGDSELWLLARADDRDPAPSRPVLESSEHVQRELRRVPLRAPLGLPARAASHVRTLAADPVDFAARAARSVRARVARVRVALGGHPAS